jgi:hypothetical protein
VTARQKKVKKIEEKKIEKKEECESERTKDKYSMSRMERRQACCPGWKY